MSIVKLGDVANRLNIHVDQATTDLEYYIGGEHIESSEFMIRKRALIKGSTIGYQFQFGFRKGDILFMTKNPHLRKCSMVDFDGLCSIATFVICTKDPSILLQKYLLIEMQSDRFWDYCEAHKSGGVNYFITWGTLSNYEFELPPIDFQQSLVEKLWAAYGLKQSYKKMITTTDEIVKSQFIEMFGARIKDTRIKDIGSVVSGKSIPTALEDIVGSIPYVKVGDFNIEGNEKYITTSPRLVTDENAKLSKMVPLGTVIFAKNGAASLSNKKRLTRIECCIDMNTMAVIPHTEQIVPEFLLASMEAMDVASFVRQGAVPSISPKTVEEAMICLPSIEDQKQYVAISEQADKSKFELKNSIAAIDKVIKSLINENL